MLDISPHALSAIRGLRILDLANNDLETTEGLAGCKSLVSVNLAKNRLGCLASVAPLLSAAPLDELDLRDNPVSAERQALDAVIVASPTLGRLNGRELTPSERPYLQQLHMRGQRSMDLADSA